MTQLLLLKKGYTVRTCHLFLRPMYTPKWSNTRRLTLGTDMSYFLKPPPHQAYIEWGVFFLVKHVFYKTIINLCCVGE